jgi:catechol 2,3-dioxygenase-like lactoylglutathione lyase family enzyme
MLFKRITHVCLNVKDLQRSLAFYRKLGFVEGLQFTRKGRDYGRYLRFAEGSYIEIFEEASHGPSLNQGLAHFCLETEDLDAVLQRLDAEGIVHSPKIQGCDLTWQTWLEDPDGNKFEVHQYSDESLQLRGGTVEADW